jgi:hypothetical protein
MDEYDGKVFEVTSLVPGFDTIEPCYTLEGCAYGPRHIDEWWFRESELTLVDCYLDIIWEDL